MESVTLNTDSPSRGRAVWLSLLQTFVGGWLLVTLVYPGPYRFLVTYILKAFPIAFFIALNNPWNGFIPSKRLIWKAGAVMYVYLLLLVFVTIAIGIIGLSVSCSYFGYLQISPFIVFAYFLIVTSNKSYNCQIQNTQFQAPAWWRPISYILVTLISLGLAVYFTYHNYYWIAGSILIPCLVFLVINTLPPFAARRNQSLNSVLNRLGAMAMLGFIITAVLVILESYRLRMLFWFLPSSYNAIAFYPGIILMLILEFNYRDKRHRILRVMTIIIFGIVLAMMGIEIYDNDAFRGDNPYSIHLIFTPGQWVMLIEAFVMLVFFQVESLVGRAGGERGK